MVDTAQQLRRQAEHCRGLASDERTRVIFTVMASEFDQQACELETKEPRHRDDAGQRW